MIFASSSLSSPGLTSTSTPRSLKMATAAGESLSEMRTREVMRIVLEQRPVRAAKIEEERTAAPRRWAPAFAGARVRSGSSRLCELGLLDNEGVVEPLGQRLDVVGFDRRAAPDPQTRWGVAIRADVV